MEEEEGGMRLSKRFSDKGGEVDYKTTSGTAWSHNFLNQKPWHPLSYPNQRRKWIAEQQHAQHQRRNEEVAREYAQEQEFFRQAALVSQKEKEKMEMMQAVSFMYVRPPGYNAESAKAAELAAEGKKNEQKHPSEGPSSSMPPLQEGAKEEKKKARPKDVFGRNLPTGDQFEALKNAPKMDTGVHGRDKPFAKEIRNVKCVRCGNFGHQSGDRECPLKDAIMPSEENRLKRDDPLTSILAHTNVSEPIKWELKQKPGLSPPRGGFDPDDPNQQIVAEDIYDEYGGFLGGGDMPDFLASLSSLKPKKKSKRKNKHKKQPFSLSSDDDVDERHNKKSKSKYYSSDDQEISHHRKHSSSRNSNQRHGHSPEPSLEEIEPEKRHKRRDDESDRDHHKPSTSRHRNDAKKSSRRKEKRRSYSTNDEDSDHDPKKNSNSGRSNAVTHVDRWSPSPYNEAHQSKNVRQKADRSRSSYVDDKNSRRKKSSTSYASDEKSSDHDHHKHQIYSRHRNTGHRERN